jgi:hypothetical protein
MREVTAVLGVGLIVFGAHQLWGPYADIGVGVFLLFESYSMKKTKTGDPNVP